ncbi:zinc finger MYM-type protein 1-like [Metopolophium dirhodum]|uniref:zinc finger MYM-type protein 1-like n=1 Tax=Metopolophium dirhodum TaxID=44670 RepID=UPI00298FAA11|nr:zinc finger MYM-type protein 1-like [Metopolophium dirhodum]
MDILKRCWTPPENYNFSEDAIAVGSKRKFNHSWLQAYAPWLAYSKILKGALCLYCVLFPPKKVQGVLGSFIIKPFTRYKDIHENCRNHISNNWHQGATEAAKSFVEEVPINIMMVSGHQKILEQNRKIISSIISNVLFCGTHDLPFRGKGQNEAGDQYLQNHIEKGKRNAIYTSPQIQNEIINISGTVIKDCIINDVKKAVAFSIMADETADISGTEQLSIGIRFFDDEKRAIREEFLGFIELHATDAVNIASAIDHFIQNKGLDGTKLVGQGYDGCATMAGKINGVQTILREKYPHALFFHCASHKLNLVVNDLNCVPEIRNTISTVKDIINFFRESVLRRKCIPNIPAFCETRWSQKYRSISIFKENFEIIVHALDKLSKDGNTATRKVAFQLYAVANKSIFIMSVILIAKYSKLLEPVVNALQSKNLDLLKCSNFIKKIVVMVKDHREHADTEIKELLTAANIAAENIGAEINLPRIVKQQQHRSNPPALNSAEFWKRSLLIPYLDSLISSLERRFSDENIPAFSLLLLHPSNMLDMNTKEFKLKINDFANYYQIKDLESEAELWYNIWKEKKLAKSKLSDMEMSEVVEETDIFFPKIKQALHISLAQPCTTCTIERSFSTLRRVKTWLRSTLTENRLNGLCILSVYRKLLDEKKEEMQQKILSRFCEDSRRLSLFIEKDDIDYKEGNSCSRSLSESSSDFRTRTKTHYWRSKLPQKCRR